MPPRVIPQLILFVIWSSIQIARCTDNRLEHLERELEKLQDTVLLVTKDNARFKRQVEDLEFKVNEQEKRIGTLEKECKIENNVASNVNNTPKEADDRHNDRNNKVIEKLMANLTYWRKRALQKTFTTEAPGLHHGNSENIAFFAYMSQDLISLSASHILVYDVTPTDVGNHYNKYSGIFTAPWSGTYVFTWTTYCYVGGYVHQQLMANAEVLDSSYCNADGAGWHRSVSGTAVAQISQGDVVFVRTHPTGVNKGKILSSDSHRSTFAGWLLV